MKKKNEKRGNKKRKVKKGNKSVKQMQNREELRQKCHDRSKKRRVARAEKLSFSKAGGGVTVIFESKYRPLI